MSAQFREFFSLPRPALAIFFQSTQTSLLVLLSHKLVFKRTDGTKIGVQALEMEHESKPKIIAAESLNDGVVITFEDGRSLFYSAQLLRDTAVQAADITDLSVEDFI